MIEEDSITCIHFVGLAVVYHRPAHTKIVVMCCYHIKYFPETLIKIFSRFPRAWEIPAKKSELNWVSFSQQQIVKMKDFCLSRKRIFSSKGSILILNAWSKAALLNCLRCFQRQFRELCQKKALFMNNIYSQNRIKILLQKNLPECK